MEWQPIATYPEDDPAGSDPCTAYCQELNDGRLAVVWCGADGAPTLWLELPTPELPPV